MKPTDKRHREITSEEYLERALDFSHHAIALREEYAEEYGDNRETHGMFNRNPNSRGVCDQRPRECKDNVKWALEKRSELISDSLDAWKCKGRRRVTWLRMKDKMMGGLSVMA